MGNKDTINIIKCITGVSLESNSELFNEYAIYEELETYLKRYFLKNKLNAEIYPLGGMGGGGAENLINYLKELWANKDYFIAAYQLAQYSLGLLYRINDNLNKTSKPKILLSMTITILESESLEEKYLTSIMRKRLLNLRLIKEDLHSKLIKKFHFFEIDITLGIDLPKYNYKFSYELKSENINFLNKFREFIVIKSAKINKETHTKYHLNSVFIKRYDFIDKSTKYKCTYLNKNYYYLISGSNIFE